MISSSHVGDVGLIIYALAAVLYFFLTVLLATSWKKGMQGGLLILASLLTGLWAVVHAHAIGNPNSGLSLYLLPLIDVVRNAAWYTFLLRALGYRRRHVEGQSGIVRQMALVAILLTVGFGALAPVLSGGSTGPAGSEHSLNLLLVGNLLLAVVGLLLVEQLYRNAEPEHKWALKYLCIGIGGMFAYDFYLYSDALLFNRVDPYLEYARGGVATLVVPMIALSAARMPHWSVSVFVSRHVVFHSATLVGSGLYLLLMAAAGYYIRLRGGDWGPTLQVVFLFGAGVVLVTLLFSGKLRAEVKVFINKHFYKNKYDYREEWLRFTGLFSTAQDPRDLQLGVLRALGQVVKSGQGAMWLRGRDENAYVPVEAWQVAMPQSAREAADGPVAGFLRQREWVINLDEYRRNSEIYGGLTLPAWLSSLDWAWLVVPLLQQEQLIGFVVIGKAQVRLGFNWEDSDLLKTVARQGASYLAWSQANEALSQAQQFEAFNRLSAYVVHDLKNLAGQLSLVVSNARRHMGNAEFMVDAVDTVENAVNKMNRLLSQLRKDRSQLGEQKVLELDTVIRGVLRARSAERPVPVLAASESGLKVRADPDRLSAVICHLVQNAQEATPDEKRVELRLRADGNWAEIEIEDTGCGMDDGFIRERLFRPFDTTKGNAGMGVGVYESRAFVRALGGELAVSSKPNKGTTFRLRLPMHQRLAGGTTVADQPLRAAN